MPKCPISSGKFHLSYKELILRGMAFEFSIKNEKEWKITVLVRQERKGYSQSRWKCLELENIWKTQIQYLPHYFKISQGGIDNLTFMNVF